MSVKINAQKQIINFITSTFLFGNNDIDLVKCESFLESGIIDSTGILELVGFLQTNFSIVIEDFEMLPENLDSINNIIGYLDKKGALLNL